MTRALLIAAALLIGTAPPAEAQRKVQVRLHADADGFVRINNIAGTVKLVGWDRDSIVVSGTVHDTPADRFQVESAEGGVTIGLWDTTVERAEPSHITVNVPASSQVWIRTGSAEVYAGGLNGTLDINSIRGDIHVDGAPASVFAESMTGRIILDVRTTVARAKTVTGHILVRGTITDATATSVSGNVLVEDAAVDRGSFGSVDGELRWVGDIRRGAALDFVTHSGAVEFLLPAAVNAEFRVSTYEGGLLSEFSVPVHTSASKIKGSEQRFLLGSGSARVNVRTFRGRVVVRSR